MTVFNEGSSAAVGVGFVKILVALGVFTLCFFLCSGVFFFFLVFSLMAFFFNISFFRLSSSFFFHPDIFLWFSVLDERDETSVHIVVLAANSKCTRKEARKHNSLAANSTICISASSRWFCNVKTPRTLPDCSKNGKGT